MLLSMGISWFLLTLMLLANSPNTYTATLMLSLAITFEAVRRKKILVDRELKPYMYSWLGIGIIMTISFLLNYSSINNYSWGIFTNIHMVLIPVILYKLNYCKLKKTMKVFTVVQFCFFTVQYIIQVIRFNQINIFNATISAGDALAGTSIGFSSVMAVTMGCMFLFFLSAYYRDRIKNDIVYASICMILSVLTGYMAGILALCIAIVICLTLRIVKCIGKMRLSKGALVTMILAGGCATLLIRLQYKNMLYVNHIVGKMSSRTHLLQLGKVAGLNATFVKMPAKYPNKVIAGVGLGNYSSRAAFITGGEYLRPHPAFISITPSKYFKEFMYPIYNYSTFGAILGGIIGTSMINAPFNQFQTIFGEGGGISLAVVIFMLLILCTIAWQSNPFLFIAVIFMSLLLMLDNWLSYPSYGIMLWIISKDLLVFNHRNVSVKNG